MGTCLNTNTHAHVKVLEPYTSDLSDWYIKVALRNKATADQANADAAVALHQLG